MINNNKYILAVIFLSCIILQAACSSAHVQKTLLNKKLEYEKLAEEKYKSNYKFLFNKDSMFVLCVKQFKSTPQFPQYRINFFIFDKNKNKILFEDSISDGKVNWINNFQVKIVRHLGIVSGDEPNNNSRILIYDVRLKKLLPFNNMY